MCFRFSGNILPDDARCIFAGRDSHNSFFIPRFPDCQRAGSMDFDPGCVPGGDAGRAHCREIAPGAVALRCKLLRLFHFFELEICKLM